MKYSFFALNSFLKRPPPNSPIPRDIQIRSYCCFLKIQVHVAVPPPPNLLPELRFVRQKSLKQPHIPNYVMFVSSILSAPNPLRIGFQDRFLRALIPLCTSVQTKGGPARSVGHFDFGILIESHHKIK